MTYRTKLTALALFRSGLDTLDISRVLRCSESQVVRDVTLERSEDLHRPDPYRPAQSRHGPRFSFAGDDDRRKR